MKGVVEGIFVLVGIVCVAVILGCLGGCVTLFWRMRRSWGSLPDRKRFGMILGIIGLSGAGYIAGAVAYVWSPLGIRYDYTVSYPAAVYAEDGQKIVFLEHRELSTYALAWTTSQIQESKTYLGVMDRDGRGKRIVGDVSDIRLGFNVVAIATTTGLANLDVSTQTVMYSWGEYDPAYNPQANTGPVKALKSFMLNMDYSRRSYFFRPPWWKL